MRTNVKIRTLAVTFLVLALTKIVHGQASCGSPTTLTPAVTCTTVKGNLQNAISATPSPVCGTGNAYSVWYKFTATSTTATVTINNFGSGLTASFVPYLQIFSGSCGSLTSMSCQQAVSGSASITLNTFTANNDYYIRIYTTTQGTANPSKNWDFDICLVSSPNDEPVSAVALTSNNACTNTTGSLSQATTTTGLPAGCESAGNHWDVWYKFTAANTTSTITLSSLGANLTSSEIQLYSGTPGSLTSLQCGTTTLTASSLAIGTTYYVRVSQVGNLTQPTGILTYNICVTHPVPPPANDACSSAISITSSTSCTNTTGTLLGATVSSPAVSSSCSGTPGGDVWYSFVAQSAFPTITLSSIGSAITTEYIQLLSGSCGSLTSLACVSASTNSLSINTATAVGGSGLTVGSTYYIRVYSPTSAPSGSNWGFDICVTDPVPATYEISRTYINVTKGNTGGTVNPGDTLEMRAILVVSSKTLDSLSFTDTLYNTKGLRLVPGSIAWRTNEGKIYGNSGAAFTDALDTDPGWYYASGLDTVIKINIGTGSSGSKRGQLTSTSYPRVFSSPCIIMATYRVVVYAAYNTKINFKTGVFTYRDQATSVLTNTKFSANNLIVYQSPGLCPNAVSATNALGAEFNGTFGTPAASAPLARNRGTTSYIGTGYTYKTFATGGGPNDYYYGIANNTSATFTTTNTWPKPDGGTGYRVFALWDITGDHTGATNTAKGNPACDTTKPVSATNPCGYMLVVNSAYKADTAFTYNVNNLCPNTYYEISGWFKNICYKCGADSLGRSSTTAGYIPTDIGDSSGVRPNIAFDVNGTDYFTTGDIKYKGLTTPTGSDSSNQWVKRGFVYLTGPSETSFLLTLRNNAPGGGGNDWALDDISVATCLPNMKYSPSLNPTTCQNNNLSINDTIRSYFNNYQNYQWQRSTDNGATWTNATGTGANGTATPAYNGSEYQYITTYTIPFANTQLADSGNRYRVVVSTTAGNLGNTNCQVTDGISIISLRVTDCSVPLAAELLAFNGKLLSNRSHLSWTTSKETEELQFFVERSSDGINFTRIGTVQSHQNYGSANNSYFFVDSSATSGHNKYRIAMSNKKGGIKYSRIIQLGAVVDAFKLAIHKNPFTDNLNFTVSIDKDARIDAAVLNSAGNVIKQQSFAGYAGFNNFSLNSAGSLRPGVYILKLQCKNNVITSKIIKQ